MSYARENGEMPWTCTTPPFPGARCLANRPGSLVRLTFPIGLPAVAGKRRLVGMKGLAPPRLPDSESGPSSIRVKPHAQLEMVLPAGISPATWRFEAARSDGLSYGSMNWGRRGDSHSRGANRPAVYETAAVAAEPRRHEMVGRHGAAPCSAVLCRVPDYAGSDLRRDLF